jgi:hypothetical protein
MDGRCAVFFVALQIAFLGLAGLPPIDKPRADETNFAIGRDFLNTCRWRCSSPRPSCSRPTFSTTTW